ncbi:MAG: ABC transporter permease subunit [Mycoplasmataceae bacterium]|nr:ABC transporter permease subunit [Mycoplasmataceae bacterium]MBR2999344.1 ABC transporter permease subunit [Mycoplasmataceae bacterium]
MNKIKLNPKQLLFLPYLIFVLLFVIVPIVFIVVLSFITPKDASINYDKFEMWKDQNFWNIFGRSFLMGILVSLTCLVISLPYVYILINVKNKSYKFLLLSLSVTPLFLFTLVKILALRGILTLIFDIPIDNIGYLYLGSTYLFLPFMIIPLYNILNSMPKNIINASQDLGYNKIITFIKIVIPYGLKAICSGIIVVFLLVVMSVAISNKLLDNSAGNQMIGNVINDLANPSNVFDMQKASSVVLITLIGCSIFYFTINAIPIIYRKIKGGIND